MPPSSKWIRDISPSDNVGKAARRTLKSRFAGVERFLQRTADENESSVEDIHQLRVWTRRLNAALNFYRDVLTSPRRKKTKKLLQEIRQAAGATRDLDVLMQRLGGASSDPRAARFLEQARVSRCQAQRSLAEFSAQLVVDQSLQRRKKKLLKSISKRRMKDSAVGSAPFGAWARQQMQDYVFAFFQAEPPPDAPSDALHGFRIEGKKLRYTMELAVRAFPRRLRKSIYPEIAELQEILGRINDLSVAQDRFRQQQAIGEDSKLSEYLDELICIDQSRLADAIAEYHQYWTSKRRDRLHKRLRKLLNDQ